MGVSDTNDVGTMGFLSTFMVINTLFPTACMADIAEC